MKDMLGNEIVAGDQVHVKVGMDWIVGVVVKVQSGGLAIAGVPKNGLSGQVPVTPDSLVLQVAVFFNTQPGLAHGDVIRLDTAKKPVLVQ